MERTESIFEDRVLRRLMEAHYNVLPQFQVGAYRIDLVVTGNGRRLAVECDGERWHGPEKLQEDAERQAILERLGWKFVRIRGSLFFRDEGRALKAMFARLVELNIAPELELASAKPSAKAEVVERVIRRAQELRAEWHSEDKIEENTSPEQGSDIRMFQQAPFSTPQISAVLSHKLPGSSTAQPTRPARLVQPDLNVESRTEIGLTPAQIRDGLFRFIPAEGKIKREELLQVLSEHWGIPIKKARSVLNHAIADERRAERLCLDEGWEYVWRA
jgi:very-short-patch-repair endonuclease